MPETLTTSEENSYTPDFDIVWHGEPFGDRRAQAAAIVTEGIQKGAAGLHGKTRVRIVATLGQFHAITPRCARRCRTRACTISSIPCRCLTPAAAKP